MPSLEEQSAEAMAAALARHQSKLRAASTSAAGADRPKSGKKSIFLRCKNIEDNIMQNLEIMRQHRVATDDIKQQRKELAERQLQQSREVFAADARAPPAPGAGEAVPDLRRGSMRDRCASMEAHLSQNDITLRGHRAFLDSAHAARRAAAAVCGGEEHRQPPLADSTARHAHTVRANSAWLGPALQAAAFAKAQHECGSDADSALRSDRLDIAVDDGADGMSTARGVVASAAALRAASSRPASAPAWETQPKRPLPAMGKHAPQRPASAAENVASRREPTRSGLASWGGSRPVSAGSMKTRCRALEENVRRNREMMQAHRESLDLVVKLRKEAAEESVW